MITDETGLVTIVTFDSEHSWDTVRSISAAHLTQGGLRKLRTLLGDSVRCVAIERHYIDRDYRDTFSGYHSKKFVTLDSRTIRLHFFRSSISPEDLRSDSFQTDDYIGYSVIRATRPYCIGRTLINPFKVEGLIGTICVCEEKVSLLGSNLKVQGFPFISQDGDATVCAESAAWMVLRYFSNRYRRYREVHPFEITSATMNYANGERVYPSRGLYLWQMGETLRREGFSPLIYTRQSFGEEFERLLYTYIESGFPVFAMLKGHVVVALGHYSDYSTAPAAAGRKNTSCFNQGFIINDDNHFPYQMIGCVPPPAKRAQRSDLLISDRQVSEISSFAVPLPEKVFLSAEHFGSLVDGMIDASWLNIAEHSPILSSAKPLLMRQYLTTCKSFKQQLNRRSMGADVVRTAYYNLPLPHFIWVCEFSTPELYRDRNQQILGEIIWDATRNAHEHAGFLAVHYPERLWIDSGSAMNHPRKVQEWPIADPKPYPVFRSNLKDLKA